MESTHVNRPSMKDFALRRRAVSVSAQDLVKSSPLQPGSPLPLLVEPAVEGVELKSWTAANRELIERELGARGAILMRGFKPGGVEEFQELIAGLADELLDYTYRSTPRSQVSGKIYTSTEYPADQSIPFHNEMSYSRTWPRKLWFFCVTPSATGGETPIADSRRVYERIDAAVRDEFERRRVMYVRNYGEHLDLPWQNVFQTADRAEVEAFCRAAGIEHEWRGGERLRTRQVCQATAVHPTTGERVWFNQAHLFHVSSLDPQLQRSLLAEYGEENLSRNTYFGDGGAIPIALFDEVRRAYAAESVSFPWQKGDLLMLDNMLVAHARAPYSGARKIVVGMADAYSAVES